MASGAPTPGAAAALARANKRTKSGKVADPGFNADSRTAEREGKPVVIGGVSFTRRRKDWGVSRLMRTLTRLQETALAKSTRLRTRIAEVEAEQIEAAQAGNDALEAELETKISDLVKAADVATEDAELVTYRLIALLLKAPAVVATDEGEGEPLRGFGEDAEDLDDLEAVRPAIEFLWPSLDVQDAAALCAELSGATGAEDADPQMSSSADG